MLALLSLTTPASADRPVYVHVGLAGAEVDEVVVEISAQEETRTLILDDSGRLPHDVKGDGTWSGYAEVPYARWTRVSLDVDGERLWSDFARSDQSGELRYGWSVERLGGGELKATRSVGTWPGAGDQASPSRALAVSFGWGLFALGYVGMLVFLQRRS